MDSSTAIQAGTPAPVPALAVAPRKKPRPPLLQALDFVASLKVTVVLFALSLFLVFFGTWAQVDRGIWEVVRDYFRNDFFVLIPIRVLTCFRLPQEWQINEFKLPYPGGFLLGWCLFFNLLAAHIVRFKLSWRRSGIIVLHSGVVLMMLGEFLTGKFATEGMINMGTGEKVNFVQDNRTSELAIVDVTDNNRKDDDVVAIYAPGLKKRKISNADLPFDVEVVEYMSNSDIKTWKPADGPPQATHGQGKDITATKLREGNGVDEDQKIDYPTAVVALKAKGTGEDLGTYLVSFYLRNADQVKIGDKVYEISLRPKRSYRDYTVQLVKAEERKHPHLDMAKDYSSYVILDDPKHDVHNMEVHIFMNSPLRYRGEAFFQAGMNPDGRGGFITTLQVVRNEVLWFPVWILPYVSCIVVGLGMLIHFGINLIGFLKVQTRDLR